MRGVVGVAEDIKYTHLSDDPGFYYYLSAAQYSEPAFLGLVVRMRDEPSRERDVIRRALQQGDSRSLTAVSSLALPAGVCANASHFLRLRYAEPC